jgi:hypothetical protein
MRFVFWFLALAAFGQTPVAPTPESVGSARGENTRGYNVLHSFETGYRWASVGGNYGRYRSDVNFGNGIRLLGSSLRVNSREGRGRFFDEISLTTGGLGNDPYQSASLRVEKNRFYRYDMSWRLNEYFNPALTVAGGLHLMDTRRRFQDHHLTLFPQSGFKLFAGYTRNTQTGPALSTVQLFDPRGDEFPLLAGIDRRRSEYRLGAEIPIRRFTLNVLRGWDRFEDDTPLRVTSFERGNNPADNTTLSSLRRREPYQGNSPYWRLALFRTTRRFAMNARYTNVSGRRDFLFDEVAVGTDRVNAARNRQILVAGSGSRPVVTGALNLTVTPAERLTLTQHTSFHNTRMDGNGAYRELENNLAGAAILDFQFLGIRGIQTLTDATVTVNKAFGIYGGYHYSTRRIQSRQGQRFDNLTEAAGFEQDNRIHSGLGGVRLRPVKGFTIQFDAEIGRADRPFYPISEKNYHALNARAQYRTRSALLTVSTRTLYNNNSVTLFSHSSRSRQYAYDASWSPTARLSFEAGYSKLHLDTNTGLAYFAASQLIESQRSFYISNVHAGNLGIRLQFHKRVDFHAGYSIVKDTGDGRSAGAVLAPAAATDTIGRQAFFVAQTFPLWFQSPSARLSVLLRNKLRWNAGYQNYGYREDFFALTHQNYRAHTGYTSLLWSF